MFRLTLHKKVLGAFLLLALVPLGLLLFNSQHSLRLVEQLLRQRTTETLDSQATRALQQRATLAARQVAGFLQEVEGDLRDLALLPVDAELWRDFSQNHRREIWYRGGSNEAPLEIREQALMYTDLAFVDATGQERLRIVDGQVTARLRNVADPAQTTYRSESYFADTLKLPAGEVWVTRVSGWYVSRADQLKGAKSPLEAVQGMPYRGVVRFCKAIYQEERLLGIVVLSLDHRHLMEFTQHISTLAQGEVVFPSYASANYAFMFDDQGWMIAHPKYWDIRGFDRQGRLVPAYSEATSQDDIEAGRLPFNLFRAGFIHPNYPRVAEAVRRVESGLVTTTNVGGSNKIMAYAPILYGKGVYRHHQIFGGVTIGAEVDQFHQPALSTARLIEQEISRYLAESWLVISLTILLVASAAYLLANSIVRPLQSLQEGTRGLIRGNLSPMVEVETNDEVGDLAQSFNTMVKELNSRRTRLVETLQALRQSRREIIRERNFKNRVFENIETGIITLDSDQQITSLNGPACRILQIDKPEEHCPWQELLVAWPELGAVLQQWLGEEAKFEENSPGNNLRRYVPLERNGRQLTYRMALFPLSFRRQAGCLLTLEDLTERVNVRQQMARIERLASLGRMSAGIAHEVRNPLTGVSLLLDELHDRLLGQDADQQLIRRALEEIERLETLVNEMLSFSTLPAPHLSFGKLEEVVEDSLFLLRKQCQRQKVVLSEEIAADLPGLMMDRDRIKQVLLNLCGNALEAMPEGGRLSLRLVALDKALELTISDTGCGIAADKLALIFEPFFTSKGQGTGLGLAISYNIVTDHGGEILIDSQLGEGTTVRLLLPLSGAVIASV